MNDHESAAMWKLYLKSDEGIAIQSTYRRLKDAIVDDEEFYLGAVRYIDYETQWIHAGNLLSPFVHKRKSFEHEQEVRALVWRWPTAETKFDFVRETVPHGVALRVDLERLIEHIYVSPSAPSWVSGLVSAVVQRYGYTFSVVQSRLNAQPLF